MTQIAKVAVAAATYAIDKPYDYLVPSGMELSVGCRVTMRPARWSSRAAWLWWRPSSSRP